MRSIHCLLHPSLPLNQSKVQLIRFPKGIAFVSSSKAKAPTQASPPNSNFAQEYLVSSFGLSSSDALRASKPLQHLQSPDKPNAVLTFLREIGVNESDIRNAVSRDPRILCARVENIWKPNIDKLQEIGFSIQVISGLISSTPFVFRSNIVPKVDFWLEILGSVENLYVVLTVHSGTLFSSSLEKVLRPNLSFLRDQCGLSSRHIIRLIKSNARLITWKPEVLKKHAERADEFGAPRSSGTFLNALLVVSYLNQSVIDARLNNLRNLGFSQDEVRLIVRTVPTLLNSSAEMVSRKVEFLIKEAGCDISDLVRNPVLCTYSLENRLIPRSLVWKLLRSKGFPVANLKLVTFMQPREEEFVEKYVLPYEHAIPGLHQAYADSTEHMTMLAKLGELSSFMSYLKLNFL